MKSKILILSNSCGGLISFRKEIMEKLLSEGHNIVVVAPHDFKTDLLKEVGCDYIDIQFNRKGINPIADIKLIWAYYNIIKTIDPDVVLSYTIKPNVYGGIACQIAHKPQIANITGLGSATENPGWLQKITIMLYKIGLHRTAHVFFQNKFNQDFCNRHKMIRGNYSLIPGSGVNLQRYKMQPYPKEHPLRFIFMARLSKQKGIDEYFRAAEFIKGKFPNTEFHIIGLCEDKSYIKKLGYLQNKGIVIYHGVVKDVRPYLENIHCTVHPSFYPEGMSNVLLESCASGKAIITTDRPGCGEIIEDGKNGFVVKQRDAEDLIYKIEKFINLPYETKKRMGIYSRLKVEREFDRNIVVKEYIRTISTILSSNY